MSAELVVVGGGQAGFALVAKLRKMGDGRAITLISNERQLPYQRPPLSKKYLLGELELDRLLFRPQRWYDDNAVSLVLNTNVLSIDTVRETIELDDGRTIPYANLALATGSYAVRLPTELGGDLDGVYAIRSTSDVDRMSKEFIAGRTVLIVGGGYIGLEAAAVASKLGLRVIVVEREDRILNRVAARSTSDYFYRLHAAHGVRILQATGIVELMESNGHVDGARLTDGTEIHVDFVICGIGIRPHQQLAAESGLKVSDGIVVDKTCRASNSKIVAAGDCACFPYRETFIRLESVQNGVDQGEAAAVTLYGDEVDYRPYPWFWSEQFDVKLQIAGLSAGFDRSCTRPGLRSDSESTWYFKEDRLLAVDAMNDSTSYLVASRLLKMGVNPRYDQISDPNFNLKGLLKNDHSKRD